MNVTGIIAEYDPFHNGHAYHLSACRAAGATHIVVVLGGNFTQRGEAALTAKEERIRMALAGGADLVIELPQPWACAGAESFAYGGISLLHHMGCIDTVCFGSECGDVNILKEIAVCMQTADFNEKLHCFSDNGLPYAAAVESAINALLSEKHAACLRSPNNTLGLEYCKTLLKLHSPLVPTTVLREGAAHNQAAAVGLISSASHIRSLVRNNDRQTAATFLPDQTAKILNRAYTEGRCHTNNALTDRVFLSYLRRLTKEDIASVPGIGEGLENRLFTAIQKQSSLEDVIQAVKTKRYTYTRLRRITCAAFLGMKADWEKRIPPYIRVLGMRENGAEILHIMQKSATLPLFTDGMQPPHDAFSKEIFDFECKASNLYGALLPSPSPCGQEFTRGMLKYHAEI